MPNTSTMPKELKEPLLSNKNHPSLWIDSKKTDRPWKWRDYLPTPIQTQFVYKFCITLSNSFSLALLITDASGWEKEWLNTSKKGLIIGSLLGLLLAISDSLAHKAESENTLESERQLELNNQINTPSTTISSTPLSYSPPSSSQSVESDLENPVSILEEKDNKKCCSTNLSLCQFMLSIGHFFNDVVEGSSSPILIAAYIGIDVLPIWQRALIYSSIAAIGIIGNYQSYITTSIAYSNKNKLDLKNQQDTEKTTSGHGSCCLPFSIFKKKESKSNDVNIAINRSPAAMNGRD